METKKILNSAERLNIWNAFRAELKLKNDLAIEAKNLGGKRKNEIKEGDFVLIEQRELNLPEDVPKKLLPKYVPNEFGIPFKVIKVHNDSLKA